MITNLETGASLKALLLKQVPYIRYLVQFDKGKPEVQAFIDSNSKVNILNPGFVKDLDLSIQKPNINTQNMNSLALIIYKIVIARFFI